jgi:adenine/guanine/hypoxanthine permease
LLPTIARLLTIKLSNPELVAPEKFQAILSATGKALPEMLVIVALGNGFILTAMLWGAMVVKLIDQRIRAAAGYTFVCAAFTFFGLIHSALPDGNIYWPWNLPEAARRIPYQFAFGYMAMGLMFLGLSARSSDCSQPRDVQ